MWMLVVEDEEGALVKLYKNYREAKEESKGYHDAWFLRKGAKVYLAKVHDAHVVKNPHIR